MHAAGLQSIPRHTTLHYTTAHHTPTHCIREHVHTKIHTNYHNNTPPHFSFQIIARHDDSGFWRLCVDWGVSDRRRLRRPRQVYERANSSSFSSIPHYISSYKIDAAYADLADQMCGRASWSLHQQCHDTPSCPVLPCPAVSYPVLTRPDPSYPAKLLPSSAFLFPFLPFFFVFPFPSFLSFPFLFCSFFFLSSSLLIHLSLFMYGQPT